MAGIGIKYLLGIDGGGTKTEFLLTDLNEKELNRVILGTSSPVNIGLENAKTVLRQGIEEVCRGIDHSQISVFAGLAGSSPSETKTEIHTFMREFGFGKCSNGTDADSALAVTLKGKDGVAVIMGTGIIAFCRSEGKIHRVGGRGYLIDKGTSGFRLGADALNTAFEYFDGRISDETIFRLVEKKLGKKLEACVSDIYAGGATFVASFAPIIFEAYNAGDKEAEKILDSASRETAKLINAANSYLKSNGKTIVCGGLSRQKDILMSAVSKYLNDGIKLEFLDEPMVAGAVLLAKSNIQGGE